MRASAESLRITAPASDGESIKGRYTFKIDAGSLPSVSSIEFRVGSNSLGFARSAPFQIAWNTAYAKDGNYAVQAIARNSSGQTISTTERIFNIENSGATSYVSSPDISQVLSGAVDFQVKTKDSINHPVAAHVFIDGEPAGYWDIGKGPTASEQTAVFKIDTSMFRNGAHELVVNTRGLNETVSPPVSSNYTALLDRIVTFENGHALMEISANYQHVYLRPGETIVLTCRRLFTDGTSAPCAEPSYKSDAPSVTSASSDGRLTAKDEGFAIISLSDSGKTTKVFVWVKKGFEIPHFSGSGQILNTYRSDKSIFPVAPFVLDPVFLRSDAFLLAETKKAAFNTLSFGFYWNPRRTDISFSEWKAAQDNAVTWKIQWAKENGFYIFATSDDGFRRPGDDAWWTLNWQYGHQATAYAMETLANSGVAVALDVVDEAALLFGWYPVNPSKVGERGLSGQPQAFQSVSCSDKNCTVNWRGHGYRDGNWVAFQGSIHKELNTLPGEPFTVQHATPDAFDFVPNDRITGNFTSENDPALEIMVFAKWPCNAGVNDGRDHPCNPFTPNDAVKIYSDWLRVPTPRVPFSWPALGHLPAAAHANWVGRRAVDAGISDYASHYWDTLGGTRTYSWSHGVQQRTFWMKEAFYSRQPYLAPDRPQLMLVCGSSFAYVKQTDGAAYYEPEKDTLDQPGCDAAAASAEIMTAAALGNAGVRQYQFDQQSPDDRAASPIGTYLQTGIRPDTGDRNSKGIWQATAYAANLLTKVLQPYVLGTASSSPGYERNITTAVRRGSDAVMLMVVNDSDLERTVDIDFSQYKSSTDVSRYRLAPASLRTDLLPGSAGETITLPRGGSVVYLFPFVSSTRFLQANFLRPKLPSAARTARLSYTYLYAEHLLQANDSIDCTNGCSIHTDPRLGEIYYQFTYVGQDGRLIGRSDVAKLPLSPPNPSRRSQQ
jgi:hypothetical protein